MRKATIISDDKVTMDTVGVGNFVTVFDEEFKEEETYKVVGIIESDPDKNYVSNESPIGSAFLGAKKGDIVSAKIPTGIAQFKILSIKK